LGGVKLTSGGDGQARHRSRLWGVWLQAACGQTVAV
jgi:hypothetical protein